MRIAALSLGICCILLGVLPPLSDSQSHHTRANYEEKIPNDKLDNWALSFGVLLWETAKKATHFDTLLKNFHSQGAKVATVDGFKMVKNMAASVETMMQHKIDSIKRIMEFAENLALDHDYDKDLGHRLRDIPNHGGFHYYNAKKINVLHESDDDEEEEFQEWDSLLSAHDREKNDKRFALGFSRIQLTSNKYFSGIPVNTSMSSVHVPTNVFDGEPKVINAIKWSRGLDPVFADNYNRDPSLSWQYFGSSTGFMRQYPAMKWMMDENEPDLYDARMRDWYIKSAASPKEIVILLDTSGSMTGLRKEIAKHVVLNILETLSEDDYVTIYAFSKYPVPLVECFKTIDGEAELVQATNENIREFQEAVSKVETEDIANFTSALTVAFELLIKSRGDIDMGANCNQAIMLVTDGVPYRYEEIFRLYNMPHKPVRVFTYLIGREISDLKAANWIACQNKGYFTHVTTLAEVKEQVLKYIPVMARPMVMYRDNHPITWTGVYADIEDPKTSRWLWDIRERSRQKKRTENYREIMRMQQENADPLADVDVSDDSAATKETMEKITRLSDDNELANFLSYGKWGLTERDIERLEKEEEMKQRLIREIIDAKTQKWTIPPKGLSLNMRPSEDKMRGTNKFSGYRLMTSVSIPVFDKNNHTELEKIGLKSVSEGSFLIKNYTEQVRVSDKKKVEKVRKVRIAELLGVAGTDVPIKEIEKLTPPHMLGVNGYSFAVNNNGYILFHPDLRPMFQEILKPNYNSVDLAEVEIVDRPYAEPRENESELFHMRRDMVDQLQGGVSMRVRQHFDDMKRATVREQDYFYHPLINTPFSLGIALPRDYGRQRVSGKVEISLAKKNVSDWFADSNWRIHPDWLYCQYNYAGDERREFDGPEETLRHFLMRSQQRDWTWGTQKVQPLPKCQDKQKNDANCLKSSGMPMMNINSHMCDRELFQSLVFDAKVTHNFQNFKSSNNDEESNEENEATPLYKNLENVEEEYQADDGNLDEEALVQDLNRTYKQFGIELAFVATRSGLLRFSDHSELFQDPNAPPLSPDDIREPHFADINNKATEEVWYKRAVDYHKINPRAFVYSIPFDVGDKKTKVTATHAIMVGKGNRKAPVAVAGMQIDYATFRQMFFNETKKCVQTRGSQEPCTRTCASDNLECYVVDNNGFVMISEDPIHTGKFFGEVDGTIMESLIQHNIYKEIEIFDYQAICLETKKDGSDASMIFTPFKMIGWAFQALLSHFTWFIIRMEIHHIWNPDWSFAMPQSPPEVKDYVDNYYDDTYPSEPTGSSTTNDPLIEEFPLKDGSPIPLLPMTYINKTTPKPCDKRVFLYELNDEKLYKPNKQTGKPRPIKGRLSNCHNSECERPFSVQLIPHTNLMLIVADKLCPCFSTKLTIVPTKIEYGPSNETGYCEKLKYNIYRKKPAHCLSYHPEEVEIKLCGGTSGLCASTSTIILATLYCLTGYLRYTQ
ncbi:voltage-dependent calcium channel subunit alpha-2/delta-3 isoform X8 [Lepeophtheirus salmonis]|uniref:voltage-dependent calcium channel subunit alpha-2/delta-3 isoform X8 n=1 Tax=Lepeophtheirus salmonis TaxID=72036 RepID=UPI003AF3AC6A